MVDKVPQDLSEKAVKNELGSRLNVLAIPCLPFLECMLMETGKHFKSLTFCNRKLCGSSQTLFQHNSEERRLGKLDGRGKQLITYLECSSISMAE